MKSILLFSVMLFFIGTVCGQEDCTIPADAVSKDAISRSLNFLGSDLFEGRGTGTTGGNLAAKYLALEFDNLNLKPIGTNGTFYQYIPMHGSRPLPASELTLFVNGSEKKLKLYEDYLLYNSGEQTFTPLPLPLVFVGYGIVAPEFDYNDYQEVDVEGKIVVFLDGEPSSDDDSFFDGNAPTIYNYPEAKQRIAISRGASGSVLIPDPRTAGYNWNYYKNMFGFEDVTLAYSIAGNLSMLINPDNAGYLFENAKYNFGDILEMKDNHSLRSFPLNVNLSFKGEFKERDFVSSNIIGMIEGNDPELKKSYIIVSAHYDHLGIGPVVNGDSIYNGVLDNAIGSSVLLELARVLKANKNLKRSIIFLLTTGEEKGLLGSSYYTDNPAAPLYKTIANINIDGIAMSNGFQSVIGIGAEFSSLKKYLEKAAELNGLTTTSIPPQFKQFEAFNRSDQIAFAQAGIPAMLILDGPDNKNMPRSKVIEELINYNKNFYHTPFDDLNLPIDLKAAAEHLRVIYSAVCLLANSNEEPEWNEGVIYNQARLRTRAERR